MVMGELAQDTELLVIGSGPGGYAAAFRAADLGLDVTLVDTAPRPGGAAPVSISRIEPAIPGAWFTGGPGVLHAVQPDGASIIDQYINAAEMFRSLRHGCFDIGFIADIALNGERFAAGGFYLGRCGKNGTW